ncbi:MAG: hypothetical protein QHJ73_19560, partial [Armatimonadota bacterium]|nr:hypothetical protein [Armatimonadota bacterium]
ALSHVPPTASDDALFPTGRGPGGPLRQRAGDTAAAQVRQAGARVLVLTSQNRPAAETAAPVPGAEATP